MCSYLDDEEAILYINDSTLRFGGVNASPEKTPYTVVGVPLDTTATFKGGFRRAPQRIREVSSNIEFYSFRCNFDFDNVLFNDIGDISIVHGDVKTSLYRIGKVIRALSDKDRIPIVIGGEHILTYGVVEALMDKNIGLIVFDAHFDLRDEYLGLRLSHACTLRRIVELLGGNNVVIIGVRAGCEDEISYARRSGISYITSYSIGYSVTLKDIVKIVERTLNDKDHVYVSIDMDVYDPAYAPAVGNPEPEGLSPRFVLDVLHEIVDDRLVGVDVVEVVPDNDVNDITSILAAKTILETVTTHYVKKFRS